MHNYSDVNKCFPQKKGGTTQGSCALCNGNFGSGWMRLMPFYEQKPLYDTWASAQTYAGTNYTPYGPCMWDGTAGNYWPYFQQVAALLCPSDGAAARKTATDRGRTNYMFSVGDTVSYDYNDGGTNGGRVRGPFGNGAIVLGFADITDGTANTAMISERLFAADSWTVRQGNVHTFASVATSPASCLTMIDPANPKRFVSSASVTNWGGRWDHGSTSHLAFNTVLPPNGPACGSTGNDDSAAGVWPPTSNHPGGVNVAMCDGSVRFVSETINAGDPTLAPVTGGRSPYGVWGAVGSRNGEEPLGDF